MTAALWGTGLWGTDTWTTPTEGLVVGNHRIRLLVRWYDREDLFPTYFTWEQKEATYQTSIDHYDDYTDLIDNIGGGIELDQDLTCDVTGLTFSAGRNSTLDPVKASTLKFTLNDPDGEHDPRLPAVSGRTRTGARVRWEVKPQDVGDWIPLYTGWIESWTKSIEPDSTEVDVETSDAFTMLARAVPIPGGSPLAEEGSDLRIFSALADIPWNDKWGAVWTKGSYSVSIAHAWDGTQAALDHLQEVTDNEDGLLWVAPDGTLMWENQEWRSTRTGVLGIDLIPNNETAWDTATDAVLCPQRILAVDDDLDMVNRVTAWRDTAYDPLVGDPPAQPDVVKQTVENTQAISYHGVISKTLSNMVCNTNARVLVVAQRWVDRYSVGANDIGDANFDVINTPEDLAPIVASEWGDTVVVRDLIGTRVREQLHELVGVQHKVTPVRWESTLILDHKPGA